MSAWWPVLIAFFAWSIGVTIAAVASEIRQDARREAMRRHPSTRRR